MTQVYVGTCSWADHANFYPEKLPSNRQISYYAQSFPIVELNSSFYRMMPIRNFQLWSERTPDGFIFDVKPFRQITWHDRKNPPNEDVTTTFRDSLEPLREAGKLGAVHFQFPPWFAFRESNVEYIQHLRERFGSDRVSVEFRHRSWLEGDHVPDLLSVLRESNVCLTVVDEPQLGNGSIPTVLEVTNPELVIVRFHGRNYKTWYAKVKTTAERFNYLYSEEELEDWVPNVQRLAEQANELHLLFNNNAQDYAVRNGRQLQRLLQRSLGIGQVVEAAGPQMPLLPS